MRQVTSFFCITVCCCFFAARIATAGDRIDVPADYPSIQQAIDAANAGDEIVVAAGSYFEAIDFRGKAITLRSEHGAEQTVIDAAGLESSVVQFWNGETNSSVLDGFTIMNGDGSLTYGLTRGGGIYIDGASPTVRNCIVSGNRAGAGGGIAIWVGSPRIIDSVFENNTATASGSGGGGAAHAYSASPIFTNVTMQENHATGSAAGGAMALHELSSASLINCLIAKNTGRHTGGIQNANSFLHIYNSTLVANAATNSSSAHALRMLGSGGISSVYNSILWGNGPDGDQGGIGAGSAMVSISYSCVAGGWDGQGNMDVEPLFVDPAAGNYQLRLESPLIDTGNNDVLPSFVVTDLAGEERFASPFQSESTQAVVDIGAYEVQSEDDPAVPCDGDVDGNHVVNVQDLLAVISNWGAVCDNCSTPCLGDANNDCIVDVQDLLLVISNWGNVCD